MDSWYKYKTTSFKIDLNKINISKQICYGNFLLSKILWKTIQNKPSQRLINKFFANASVVLQATVIQKGFNNKELSDIYVYIDNITKELLSSSNSAEDLALMLGNMSELEDMKYTFTELIAFVRAIAIKI